MKILHVADTHLGYSAYRKATEDGINQRELVGQLCQTRVHLVDAHPRHFGGDGLIWSTIFQRSVRLHIPGVKMTRTTTEQYKDAGFL